MGLSVHLPPGCGTVESVNHKREQPEWYVFVAICVSRLPTHVCSTL